MNHYASYSAEEFAQDGFFIEWVKYNNIATETLWQNWLETYPFKRNEVEIARQIILISFNLPLPDVTDSELNELKESILYKIETHAIQEKKQLRTLIRYAVAASIAALLCILNWDVVKNPIKLPLSTTKFSTDQTFVDIYNNTLKSKLVALPDGSSVLLKKGSKISYQAAFNLQNRHVYLQGEAFFEVVKNPHRPFYVHTPHLITKVLGTSFNVCAFDSEKATTVTVKTGKVSVFKNEGKTVHAELNLLEDKGIILNPHQKAIFSRNNLLLYTENIEQSTVLHRDEIEDMSFNYEETPFREICQQLQQAYQVQIKYDETTFGNCPITAYLTGVSFQEKLNLICKALRAEYKIQDDQVVISGRGCG